jgi:prepilin-type N-terminal cleavage/methylation domain-containing protein
MNSSLETRSLPAVARCYPAQLYLDHSHSRARASYPSCVAVYPRDSRSRRVLCRSARRSIVTRGPAVTSAKAGHSSLDRANARAFTLLELLVVIVIIVILVSFLFPAFRGIQDQAKKTQAKNDVTQIATAVNAFYTEYGKYPIVTTDDPITNTKALMDVLRALDTTNNPRQIVFVSPPNVKDNASPRSGIDDDGQWYDPWGITYKIKINGTYNNQLTNPYVPDSGAGPTPLLNIGALAWSYGADGVIGTKQSGGTGDGRFKDSINQIQCDDAISWQ